MSSILFYAIFLLIIFSLKKSHTGVYFAEVICKALHEYRVLDKLLSLPGDNTSNNIIMAHALKGPRRLPSTHIARLKTHVLCVRHIFDLANKVSLSNLPMPAELF